MTKGHTDHSRSDFGSGCGSAGGGPTHFANGGNPPKGIPQGYDGLDMPKAGTPPVWIKGAEVEVAWAISANHGGGCAPAATPNLDRGTPHGS